MLSALLLAIPAIAVLGYLYVYLPVAFTFALPFAAIGIVSYIYAHNNPVGHKRAFRIRSYLNWLPLGLTYASLYMGRYNLTVAKSWFGEKLMDKVIFGKVSSFGSVVYGCSFLINGPITDRIGGKATILIGAFGAAIANLGMGWYAYQAVINPDNPPSLYLPYLVLYAANMYFQSFGAVSIVKVNAAWFHIKERGVFGGVFGTLISLGIYLAFDVNDRILQITKADDGTAHTYWAFWVPAAILLGWVALDFFALKDTPGQAGFEDFHTGDAGADDTSKDALSPVELYKRLLSHPVILMMIAIEFCSGVLRNGIMHWGRLYAKDFNLLQSDVFFKNWGLILMVAGITGGFFAGFVSDRLFQSRRGPSAFFLYAGMLVGFGILAFAVPNHIHMLAGVLSFFISMCVIGVHGMLSGTASMDFGGKKAAATTAGVIDGFVYLGTGFQFYSLGYIIKAPAFGWNYWALFLLPFTLIGLYFTRRIWNAFPDAQKKGGH